MAEQKDKADMSDLTFEQAIDTLTGIVDGIEAGQMPLQESIDNYEKGMALIKHCRTILQAARSRSSALVQNRSTAPDLALLPLVLS